MPASVDGYHGRPILKRPVWTWEVPAYFFTGGLAGAASMLAAAADLSGRAVLATSARRVAAVAALTAPPLLVSDLGRPARFANMLRVAKPSSPMSVGSWTLAGYAPAAIACAGLGELHRAPRVCRTAGLVAAATGPVMATYTAVLVSTTAIPVWQAARRELPYLFAASAAAAGAASTVLVAPPGAAGPARRLAVAGAVGELATTWLMRRRLGTLTESYDTPPSSTLEHTSTICTVLGAAVLAIAGRSRARVPAAALLVAGSACKRFAVLAAGRDSAGRPGQLRNLA